MGPQIRGSAVKCVHFLPCARSEAGAPLSLNLQTMIRTVPLGTFGGFCDLSVCFFLFVQDNDRFLQLFGQFPRPVFLTCNQTNIPFNLSYQVCVLL